MTELRHKFDFLNGAKCGYHPHPGVNVRVGLSWDTVTCPDCLKLKEAHEPESVTVPTLGD